MFFRKQDNITNELQKELVQRLGELSGKPATSRLHIHPVSNGAREHGANGDNEISVISSEGAKKLNLRRFLNYDKRQSQKGQWHSDITFEPIPSDYALLRMTQLPKTGGGESQESYMVNRRHFTQSNENINIWQAGGYDRLRKWKQRKAD